MPVDMSIIKPCPFCGSPPSILPEDPNEDRFYQLKHTCFGLSRPLIIEWCRLERLVRIWNTRDLGISTEYHEIAAKTGMYWVRGVIEKVPVVEWKMVVVFEGKWWYIDGSGGHSVDRGEWIFIPQPQPEDG